MGVKWKQTLTNIMTDAPHRLNSRAVTPIRTIGGRVGDTCSVAVYQALPTTGPGVYPV